MSKTAHEKKVHDWTIVNLPNHIVTIRYLKNGKFIRHESDKPVNAAEWVHHVEYIEPDQAALCLLERGIKLSGTCLDEYAPVDEAE